MIKKAHLYLFIFILLILSFFIYILNIAGVFDKKDKNLFIDKENGFSITLPEELKAVRESEKIVIKSKREIVANVRFVEDYSNFLDEKCISMNNCEVRQDNSFLTLTGNSGEVVYFEEGMKEYDVNSVINTNGPFFLVYKLDGGVVVVEPPRDVPIGEVDTVMQRQIAESINFLD